MLTPSAQIDTVKISQIEHLLQNKITITELMNLRKSIDADDLSVIIQRIYDLNESTILKIATIDTSIRKINEIKNKQRNTRFIKKINNDFRNPKDLKHLVILAEGDSWFNYPVILTDVIDRIAMDPELAVYSLASGGDWLLNMLTARKYVEELSILRPDIFLISGGGNDLVGSYRLGAMIQSDGNSVEYESNPWALKLISKAEKGFVPLDEVKFRMGLNYISKDFFALLMFFHLQYYLLIDGILSHSSPGQKFNGIRILTQGYDYPIPSHFKGYGLNPLKWYVPFIRIAFGHGSWLKTPLQLRSVLDPTVQQAIVYAMMYLFNEMMIEMGTIFSIDKNLPDRVFHIDSRGSVGTNGWTDELHPLPQHFIKIGEVFTNCIKQNKPPSYGQVYVVNQFKN